MAKVVRIDETKAKQRTHSSCDAVIEYFENEVETRIESDYGGGSDTYKYLKCPHCGQMMRWC